MTTSVKVICDSYCEATGKRLISIEARYPRIIHEEVLTHRMLSRSASGSRAIPVARMIEQIRQDPFVPKRWGSNQRGMQAGEDIPFEARTEATAAWLTAHRAALDASDRLRRLNVVKHLANRIIEPWSHIDVIISATEWENFLMLRWHGAAAEEMEEFAHAIVQAVKVSAPTVLRPGEWHLPYVLAEEVEHGMPRAILWSVARCARVSYMKHGTSQIDYAADEALYSTLLESGHMCYDAATEVLTSRGFVRWPAVRDDDRLAAVDLSTRAVHFEAPQALHVYDAQEPLYGVAGQQLDLLVTQNHRMVTSRRHMDGTWTPFGFEAARDVMEKPRRYLKSGLIDQPSTVELPFDVPRLDFLRFVGFFVGDGYTHGEGNQARFHMKKTRKVGFLAALALPFRRTSEHRYVVELPDLGRWLEANCYDRNGEKKLPDWTLALSGEEMDAVIEGLRNSDGSARRNTWVYATTSQAVADTLQAMLHLRGLVGSFTYTPYATGTAIRVNVSKRTTPRVETGQRGRALTYRETLVPYVGKVYCATVSTGALIVRRNGHVVVSGNSPFEHQAQATDRPVRSGNYTGWIQYRKLIPNEDVWALNPRAAEIRDALRVRRPNALATLAGILTGAEVPREDHRGHSEHDRPGPHHRRHEE